MYSDLGGRVRVLELVLDVLVEVRGGRRVDEEGFVEVGWGIVVKMVIVEEGSVAGGAGNAQVS